MAVSGTIILDGGTEIEITDSSLVKGGLSVSMSTCPYSKFMIGSFTAAVMRLKIYDDDAQEHEFSGAEIRLSVTEGEETVPLGVYRVDGAQSVREKKQVSLVAYDDARRFDTAIPSEGNWRTGPFTPTSALGAICEAVGVPLANETLSDFPNSGDNFMFTNKSIQTFRDAVMHIACLMCANAVIDREGRLEIRRARYLSNGSDIIEDHIISGDKRISTSFSDVRTYIRDVRIEGASEVYELRSGVTSSDEQARPAALSVWCPLMSNGGQAQSWLSYIDGFKQRKVKTKIFCTAKIKLGDTCRFSGGVIDVRRSIVGVVTGVTWKYNGFTEVECAAPEAVQKEGT